MIDFWELTGRLLLMDPDARQKELYADTGLLPLQQPDGCILLTFCNSATLPFSVAGFYDPLRKHFTDKYMRPNNLLLSPVISMFALGEIGVMFFNDDNRKAFDALSKHVRTVSVLQGKTDKGSASLLYIGLTLMMMDTKVRKSVNDSGDFLGLEPTDPADRDALKQLVKDQTFTTLADTACFGNCWSKGSGNTLLDQMYGINKDIPFRHFRFVTP